MPFDTIIKGRRVKWTIGRNNSTVTIKRKSFVLYEKMALHKLKPPSFFFSLKVYEPFVFFFSLLINFFFFSFNRFLCISIQMHLSMLIFSSLSFPFPPLCLSPSFLIAAVKNYWKTGFCFLQFRIKATFGKKKGFQKTTGTIFNKARFVSLFISFKNLSHGNFFSPVLSLCFVVSSIIVKIGNFPRYFSTRSSLFWAFCFF